MPPAVDLLPPPRPSPGQLLKAAQALACGVAESEAAAGANMTLDTLRSSEDDADFRQLRRDCDAVEAMPRAARDERLERLMRATVERGLMEGRMGAVAAALRLLGIVPTRGPARAEEADPDEDEAEEGPESPSGERWGMRSDGGRGWLGPDDGLPVMPDREVAVVEAPAGPVRLLDIRPASAPTEFLAVLDRMDEAGVETFNRGARPYGGPQWDPRNRTLWPWHGKTPAEIAAAKRPDPSVSASAPPPTAASPAGGGGEGSDAIPAPAGRAAIAAPPDLAARLRRLLSGTAAVPPDELDLAEAVCSLSWPNWPPYQGAVDLHALRRLLAATPVDGPTLSRLGRVPAKPSPPATGPAGVPTTGHQHAPAARARASPPPPG